jgi:hypothetical protein
MTKFNVGNPCKPEKLDISCKKAVTFGHFRRDFPMAFG